MVFQFCVDFSLSVQNCRVQSTLVNPTCVGKQFSVLLHPLLGQPSVSLLVTSSVRNSCLRHSDFEIT